MADSHAEDRNFTWNVVCARSNTNQWNRSNKSARAPFKTASRYARSANLPFRRFTFFSPRFVAFAIKGRLPMCAPVPRTSCQSLRLPEAAAGSREVSAGRRRRPGSFNCPIARCSIQNPDMFALFLDLLPPPSCHSNKGQDRSIRTDGAPRSIVTTVKQ